jgi:hypothetical protein
VLRLCCGIVVRMVWNALEASGASSCGRGGFAGRGPGPLSRPWAEAEVNCVPVGGPVRNWAVSQAVSVRKWPAHLSSSLTSSCAARKRVGCEHLAALGH